VNTETTDRIRLIYEEEVRLNYVLSINIDRHTFSMYSLLFASSEITIFINWTVCVNLHLIPNSNIWSCAVFTPSCY
jgi:aromatic ring-cleaving dioxygenase